jgi:hypothetical protein
MITRGTSHAWRMMFSRTYTYASRLSAGGRCTSIVLFTRKMPQIHPENATPVSGLLATAGIY